MTRSRKTKVRPIYRRWWFVLSLPFVLLGAVVLGLNLWMTQTTKAGIYNQTDDIPFNRVGLVLGTSPWLRGGGSNPFFVHRIEAATALYKAGKVTHLVVSGDNRHHSYNEPQMMKNALQKRGIPAHAVTLDYAGFRTLDSVVRLHKIFGQKQFTVVSQRDHCYRAVFIARHHGLEATGFAAADAPFAKSLRVRSREVLARVKAILDLYILDKQPHHMGDPILIPNLPAP
ncbi:MAG: ElyC/SanA/YdcF family protein [Acidobacteriota bacterium]|nr:ElyC/SanA/YdcF family protein [Acidobacteriota bacterium]